MSHAKRMKEKGRIPGGFVPLRWELLNSMAYKKLPPSASKVLPFFIGKIKLKDFNDPARYTTPFSFSYKEAEKHGFSKATHFRSICHLVAFGFIDPCSRGGLRGLGYSCSEFKLSGRWLKYGTPDFVEIIWTQFEPKKPKSIPEMRQDRSINENALVGNGV